MARIRRTRHLLTAATTAGLIVFSAACGSASSSSGLPVNGVTWMQGYTAPGTPATYNKVGVIKVGSSSAKNVLVLEPGTSAGSAYFVPLAEWITSKAPGWQVWSVERRENLLEDQSMLNRAKQHRATSAELYNYYLGYLRNPSVKNHLQPISNTSVEFAKQWGMNVAVEDLHVVIDAARRMGGKVVLGGHSLGGSVVTAYASWDFNGRPGADGLAGLIYIDGGSGSAESAQQASQALQSLDSPSVSPWLAFGGIAAPYAGIFSSTGSLSAVLDPNGASQGQSSGLLPTSLVPDVRVTNLAQYGYALNVATSPSSLLAAQAHLGEGLAAQPTSDGLYGWNGAGALTPIARFATMFSGYPMNNVDGTEWYFPQRLTDDTKAVGNGDPNPAQEILDVNSTLGHDLPKNLLIYAFGARLGGQAVLDAAQALAEQSGIPMSNLTLVNDQSTYAHNDPAGAYPHNAFFADLLPFLGRVSSGR